MTVRFCCSALSLKRSGILCALVALFLVAAHPAAAQEKASLSGFVNDQYTGETLLLANVYLFESQTGAATNNSGYYTITGIQPGTYTIACTYIGYQDFRTEITLAPGEARRLDISLAPEGILVDEVVVSADRETEEELRRLGVAQLDTDIIKKLPAVLEPDVFRSLQILPGVKAASDYSSGLYVRGGSPDQTLILLDRTTVYNPSHFFGFFSTFNPDAVKDVRLYKGGYPAEYGGRLGAVVDIYNKDGNRVRTGGTASLGLLASRAMVEGPYSRGSWMLAVRRSTLEPLLSVLQDQDIDGIPESFYFYDANGKINFDASPNDRLALSFYAGQDKLELPFLEDASVDLSYGNRTFSGNWTHIVSEKLFSNFTLTSSSYFSKPNFTIASTEIKRTNNVDDISVKGDFEYIPGDRHSFNSGFWAGNFTFRLRDSFDNEENLTERIQSIYGSAYAQHVYKPSQRWRIQTGVRTNYFDEGNFLRLEPRLSIEHRPSSSVRLQLGYGRYYQFLTLITSELFSGSDIWLTTDDGVEPAFGDQFVGGVKVSLSPSYRMESEVYYRSMRELFELDPLLGDAAGLDYSELFHFGEGYAYGNEWVLEKGRGKLTGFVGYTYSITRRRFEDFEEFKLYPPKYDRTHDIDLLLNYQLGKKWRATGVWAYATGQAYTEPSRQFKLIANPLGSTVKDVLASDFNGARLPAYHRLDLGISKSGRFFKFANYDLQLQVLNAYNRRNIWFFFYDFEAGDSRGNTIDKTEIPQIPVPLPNISFTIEF
ncbi:MAG: TonB-dependent receptor [Rhodothermales bacterium]|nr:TonB-dependent receptor [Rhodothermales bacterium]